MIRVMADRKGDDEQIVGAMPALVMKGRWTDEWVSLLLQAP